MTLLRYAHPTRACHIGRGPAVRPQPRLPRMSEHTTLLPTSQIVMYKHTLQKSPNLYSLARLVRCRGCIMRPRSPGR